MGLLAQQIAILVKTLDNGFVELEALRFPGMSELGDGQFPAEAVLKGKLLHELNDLKLHQLHQHAIPIEIEVRRMEVEVPPAKRNPAWKEPVRIAFHVLEWGHAEDAWIAYIPALGIEVAAKNLEQLRQWIPNHIRSALLRMDAAKSLGELVPLARWQDVTVLRRSWEWQPRSPKDVELQNNTALAKKEDVLSKVAILLDPAVQPAAFEVEELVQQLARGLTSVESRSVLLVGAAGSGKTAVFKECVRQSAGLGLGGHPVWMTTGSRLVAGMTGFGMWQERCMEICRALGEKQAILHVGNLPELIQVGRHEYNRQGMAEFLRPYLERRDIQVVAECTPEQLSLIETIEPRLIDVFTQIRLPEPDLQSGRKILFRWAEAAAKQGKGSLLPEALEAVDRLHRRFGSYSIYPGRPLRFLRNLLETQPGKGAITKSQVFAEFSNETGLPLFLVDETLPMDLRAARQWFKERLVHQDEAVDLIVDLLATAKARMARPRKPIASMIFVGPTGVGKTQMAKCLATYLFGDPHRLVRLDMSEFSDAESVKRLVGDATGEEGLLTAKVREQPFSIVLFDEFEKADPLFYDLILQVLGEGRLTDDAGRTADFTNSVVIMTSNLGAQSFSSVPLGFVPSNTGQSEANEHFTRELEKFIRPELFNRMDAIVPFEALDAGAIIEVTRRELALIQQRDGILSRRVKLTVENDAVAWLAARGFDAHYGARPLKRAVQEQLLAPLAEALNSYDGSLLLDARVFCAEDGLHVSVTPQMDGNGCPLAAQNAGGPAHALARACGSLRDQISRLKRSDIFNQTTNQIFQRKALARDSKASTKHGNILAGGHFKLSDLELLIKNTEDLEKKVCNVEDMCLLSLLGYGEGSNESSEAFDKEWEALLLGYLEASLPQPTDLVCLGVYCEDLALLDRLAAAYREVAQRNHATLKYLALEPGAPIVPGGRPIRRRSFNNWDELGRTRRLGVVLEIKGKLIHPYFQPEEGKHIIISPDKERAFERSFLVHVRASSLEKYEPPKGVELPAMVMNASVTRTYDAVRCQIRDQCLGRLAWTNESLARDLTHILDSYRDKALQNLLSH